MPDSNRLLRLPEVRARTGLSRSSVYRLAARGQFPGGVKLTPHSTAWPERDVDAWIASRPKRSEAPEAA